MWFCFLSFSFHLYYTFIELLFNLYLSICQFYSFSYQFKHIHTFFLSFLSFHLLVYIVHNARRCKTLINSFLLLLLLFKTSHPPYTTERHTRHLLLLLWWQLITSVSQSAGGERVSQACSMQGNTLAMLGKGWLGWTFLMRTVHLQFGIFFSFPRWCNGQRYSSGVIIFSAFSCN